MNSPSLDLDETPPLGLVLPFFLTSPVLLALGGVLLVVRADSVLVSSWHPATVALTHLGTLGFLLMTMLGAFYQVAPVVAGARVPFPRLARVVHALLLLASLFFAAAGLTATGSFFVIGSWCAAGALLLFLGPAGWALGRSKTKTATTRGMRVALLALLATGALGFLMARGYGSGAFLGDRGLSIQLHLSIGLLCWVGGLLVSVSWQVVPMFYLAGKISSRAADFVGLGVIASLGALTLVALLPLQLSILDARFVALLAGLPAATAVWLVHPWVMRGALAARKRRRPDATLELWNAGLRAGPLTFLAAGLAFLGTDPRWVLLWAFLTIWGWAGLILHGMLHRIVPFLVWLHWLSPHSGKGRLPTTRQLLPDERTRTCLRIHLFAGALGLAAIAWPEPVLVRTAGCGIIATAGSMLFAFTDALKRGHIARRFLVEQALGRQNADRR